MGLKMRSGMQVTFHSDPCNSLCCHNIIRQPRKEAPRKTEQRGAERGLVAGAE